MSTGTATALEDSLERPEAGRTHTSSDRLADILEERCPEPAIGVELPCGGIDLPDWVNIGPTPADPRGANAGVTAAGLGITDYGSVVVQSTPDNIESVSLFGDLHIAILWRSDTVPGMPEAFDWLGEEFRAGHFSATIATGSSVTADMGVLVRGAHSPKDIHMVILDE